MHHIPYHFDTLLNDGRLGSCRLHLTGSQVEVDHPDGEHGKMEHVAGCEHHHVDYDDDGGRNQSVAWLLLLPDDYKTLVVQE